MNPISWYQHNQNFRFMSDEDIENVIKHFNLTEEEIRDGVYDLSLDEEDEKELLTKLLS